MNSVKIRQATEADYNQLAEIWKRSVLKTHEFLDKAYFNLIWQKIKTDFFPMVSLYVAYDNNAQLTGFLGVSDKVIEMLFVDPVFFRMGVGKHLALFAIKALGIKKVDVNEQNESALAFYKKLGFEVVSRQAVDSMGKPYPILNMELI